MLNGNVSKKNTKSSTLTARFKKILREGIFISFHQALKSSHISTLYMGLMYFISSIQVLHFISNFKVLYTITNRVDLFGMKKMELPIFIFFRQFSKFIPYLHISLQSFIILFLQ